MIVIIDYNMGNLGSIKNMIRKIGSDAIISSNSNDILNADKLILPGVGAFDNGMKNLDDTGLISILTRKVIVDRTPILGICLGMQLFTEKSEEGALQGLGWINGYTKKFDFLELNTDYKIPHMGWNDTKTVKESLLFSSMHEDPRFYFVHSYHIVCNESSDILTTTDYGYEFTSAIEKNNIYGTQFHPEKSHKYGMKIIKNFVELI